MSFTINNMVRFIDSFQFVSSSLDSLVENLSKNDFKYSSQEFDNIILDLVKEKELYEYMNDVRFAFHHLSKHSPKINIL